MKHQCSRYWANIAGRDTTNFHTKLDASGLLLNAIAAPLEHKIKLLYSLEKLKYEKLGVN
jgi:hypothetical protein